MKDDFEVEEKKQAAADVLDLYSKFVMACIGHQIRPCDMRMHLRKEVSGLPTSLKRDSFQSLGASSSSGTARLDKHDSFQALWSLAANLIIPSPACISSLLIGIQNIDIFIRANH